MRHSVQRPIRASRRRFAVPALVVILGACDKLTEPAADVAGRQASFSVATADAAEQTQLVARGLAAALAKPDARAHLRNAMRDSRWSEHKLVLQDYVHTRDGLALVADAAAALGTTPQGLRQTIAALPMLDFHVPFVDHRLTWRGSPDILVASTFDGDAPAIQAFAT